MKKTIVKILELTVIFIALGLFYLWLFFKNLGLTISIILILQML